LRKKLIGDQLLNFFAFGTFSPESNLSAPTFLPLLGHPDFLEQAQSKIVKMSISDATVRFCFFIIMF